MQQWRVFHSGNGEWCSTHSESDKTIGIKQSTGLQQKCDYLPSAVNLP
jgi:hypothetical protein